MAAARADPARRRDPSPCLSGVERDPRAGRGGDGGDDAGGDDTRDAGRSEEHTSELQSLMRISYAVFCLKKKTTTTIKTLTIKTKNIHTTHNTKASNNTHKS